MPQRAQAVALGTLVWCLMVTPAYALLTDRYGWAGKRVMDFSDRPVPWALDADIDGQVGYPLVVDGPRANCSDGSWTVQFSDTSLNMPPGLEMNMATGAITGIPRERGHWIVTLRASLIQCGGQDYGEFTQELRFHIAGTGKVIE